MKGAWITPGEARQEWGSCLGSALEDFRILGRGRDINEICECLESEAEGDQRLNLTGCWPGVLMRAAVAVCRWTPSEASLVLWWVVDSLTRQLNIREYPIVIKSRDVTFIWLPVQLGIGLRLWQVGKPRHKVYKHRLLKTEAKSNIYLLLLPHSFILFLFFFFESKHGITVFSRVNYNESNHSVKLINAGSPSEV